MPSRPAAVITCDVVNGNPACRGENAAYLEGVIVHWPKGIPKEKTGKMVRDYAFLPDIMATCLELSKATYPKESNGNTIIPMSGRSLTPLFKGDTGRLHTEPIFWEHEGNKAVRLGKYKLVQLWEDDKKDNWELYDMEQDRTEMNNLVEKMPKKAEELIALYDNWAQKTNVLPWKKVMRIRAKKE